MKKSSTKRSGNESGSKTQKVSLNKSSKKSSGSGSKKSVAKKATAATKKPVAKKTTAATKKTTEKKIEPLKLVPPKTGSKSAKQSKKDKDQAQALIKEQRASESFGSETHGRLDRKILAIDIGGTNVKMLVNGEAVSRSNPSGLELTPTHLVELVGSLAKDWDFDFVSIGYPGLCGPNGPLAEPYNLGPGWVAFDFSAAFGKPVKVINDAAMQAIGSYEGGRMLFLGFGTGTGSALIADGVIISLELSNLRWDSRRTVGDITSKTALHTNGKRKWRKAVTALTEYLARAFLVDYIVIGGGNAKYLKDLPIGVRRGHNQAAFRGGFRVWELDFIPTVADSVANRELRVLY